MNKTKGMLNVNRTKKSTLSGSVLGSDSDWSGQENKPLRSMNCGQNYEQISDDQLIKKDCTRSTFSPPRFTSKVDPRPVA
jgi:hypothetical protein